MVLPALSIAKKLIGLSVLLVSVIVIVLTVYFSSRQIAEIQDRVTNTAEMYGHLLSKQLQSAIAFGDRETAREVLDSLVIDRDVVTAVVFTAGGDALYAIGTPGPELPALVRRNGGGHVVIAGDRSIVAVAPIVSLEGPRGSIAIELSTARASEHQRTVTMTGIAVGGVAVVIGAISAWLIARSLVRRLRRLSGAAAKISGGQLDVEALADASRDELGMLAHAFDHMAGQLRELFDGVRRRTDELSEANHRLVSEISERAKIEVELLRAKIEVDLRRSQKHESIGRLAAGIAHELNTPIQFVSDSCNFLREATGDLLDLQRRGAELLRRVHDGELTYDDALFELAGAREAVDAAYLEDQVPGAIQRAVGGLERMAKIVASMKEFSHPGRSDMSFSDLNRGLLSTLVIARNEYKDFAEVETELGELPQVMCHIGELNQVFLNLIVNAAHAIEDVAKKTGRRGEIRVRTWVDRGEALVSISDTGGGIPDAVREHIFEPFFTTKEIGRGTGQGLTIARTIVVENHRGRLLVESITGTGTTFTIALPIEGHQLVAAAALPPAAVVAASPPP